MYFHYIIDGIWHKFGVFYEQDFTRKVFCVTKFNLIKQVYVVLSFSSNIKLTLLRWAIKFQLEFWSIFKFANETNFICKGEHCLQTWKDDKINTQKIQPGNPGNICAAKR